MTQQTFLVEIGTEELPPKALRSLAESFAANFTAELDSADIAHGEVSWFAAPRRLALKVAALLRVNHRLTPYQLMIIVSELNLPQGLRKYWGSHAIVLERT